MDPFEEKSAFEKLKELYDCGYISEYEFKRRKAEEFGMVDDDNDNNKNQNVSVSSENNYQYDYSEPSTTEESSYSENNYYSQPYENNIYHSPVVPVSDFSDSLYADPSAFDFSSVDNITSYPPPPPPQPPVYKAPTSKYNDNLSSPPPLYFDPHSITYYPSVQPSIYNPPVSNDHFPPYPLQGISRHQTSRDGPSETEQDEDKDLALEEPIQVKDNYKIYGNITDKIVVYYKSVEGSFQSEPIDIEGKSRETIIEEVEKFIGGIKDFTVYRILYKKRTPKTESDYGMISGSEQTLDEVYGFEKGGHYLIKPRELMVHRGRWTPMIRGADFHDYIRHGFTSTDMFKPKIIELQRSHYYGFDSGYDSFSKTPFSYSSSLLRGRETPMRSKISFFKAIRTLQEKYNKPDTTLSKSSIQLQPLIKQCIEERKCLICSKEIALYESDTLKFLCSDHFNQKIMESYNSIDFSAEEGKIDESEEKNDQWAPTNRQAYTSNPYVVVNKPATEEVKKGPEELVIHTEKYRLVDVDQIIFEKSGRSLRSAFQAYIDSDNNGFSQFRDPEFSGVASESIIHVSKFISRSQSGAPYSLY